MKSNFLYEKLAILFLSLLIAIVCIYSYKMISLVLPLVTLIVIWLEGSINNISLRLPIPLMFFLPLLIWSGLSIFWVENQVPALKAFVPLTVTFMFSLIFLSCLMQATPKLIATTYSLIKIVGFCLIFLLICQFCIDTFFADFINYKGLAPYMLRMKPTGSILGLTVFVGCGFLWTYKNKVLSVASFFIVCLLITFTLCQTATYGVIIGTIVFFLSYLRPILLTRIGIIFSYTFLIFSPFFYTYIVSPATIANIPYLKWIMNHSLFHRYLAWEYYSQKFLEKPLLGWGVESSRYLPTNPELAPGFRSLLHPHNNSVQVYVELGLVGGILYALFFSSLFYIVGKYVKDRFSIAICNATITFGFVGAEITHNVWRNYWLSLVVLTAGLIIIFLKTREEQLRVQACHLGQPLTQ